MVYFDSTATTTPSEEILDLYKKVNEKYWYNTTGKYNEASIAKDFVFHCEKKIIDAFQVKNHVVYFTSGATEANNLAIQGFVKKYPPSKKVRIITSIAEHASVLNVYKEFEQLGYDVVYVHVDSMGQIDLNELEASINQDTILVSCMWVNNVTGVIQPIEKIIPIVQGIGKVNPKFRFDDIDFFTFTAHKIHGLKGTGALVCKKSIALHPLFQGGGQQDGVRSGTVDVPGIACLSKALLTALRNTTENDTVLKEVFLYMYQKLSILPYIYLHSFVDCSSHAIIHFSMKNIKGETLAHYLEQKGFLVGTGSSCHSSQKTRDEFIYQMTNDEFQAMNSIRVSLASEISKVDIDSFCEALKEIGESNNGR